MRELGLALAGAILALAAPGCGDDENSPDEPAEGGPWGDIRGAVDLSPSQTPRWVAHEYVQRLAGSATPFALAQYDPRVRRAVGLRRFAIALELGGSTVATQRARTVAAERSGRVARVRVEVRSGGKYKPYRFVLVRRDGVWRLAFDSLTVAAIGVGLTFEGTSRGLSEDDASQRARRAVAALRAGGDRALPR